MVAQSQVAYNAPHKIPRITPGLRRFLILTRRMATSWQLMPSFRPLFAFFVVEAVRGLGYIVIGLQSRHGRQPS